MSGVGAAVAKVAKTVGAVAGGLAALVTPDPETVKARVKRAAARRANRLEGRAHRLRKRARRAARRGDPDRYADLMAAARDLDLQARMNWLIAAIDPRSLKAMQERGDEGADHDA